MSSLREKYAQAVRELESRGIMPDRAPSLEPTEEGLRALDFGSYRFDPARVIIVAGTNGKGSTSATLESLLVSAGVRVGLYTSPHLAETTERFRLNGRDIDEELFVGAYEAVMARTAALKLSHFELLTLMAAWIFCSGKETAAVDWLILEVGLGGLWDATNAIPHRTCVITTIGFDHQNFLGNDLASIASNKLGVIQDGAKVIHLPFPPEAEPAVARAKSERQASWKACEEWKYSAKAARRHGEEPEFELETRWGRAPLSLPGRRGAQNAALALTVFAELGFDPARHLAALSQVRWGGRMERIHLPFAVCPVYLSGDHNPQGIQSVVELLEYYPRKRLLVLLSTAVDKDFDGIIGPLAAIPRSEIYLTRNPFRGAELSHYGPWLGRAAGAWDDPAKALREVASRAGGEDLILVTGSLYLVGWIKKQGWQVSPPPR